MIFSFFINFLAKVKLESLKRENCREINQSFYHFFIMNKDGNSVKVQIDRNIYSDYTKNLRKKGIFKIIFFVFLFIFKLKKHLSSRKLAKLREFQYLLINDNSFYEKTCFHIEEEFRIEKEKEFAKFIKYQRISHFKTKFSKLKRKKKKNYWLKKIKSNGFFFNHFLELLIKLFN